MFSDDVSEYVDFSDHRPANVKCKGCRKILRVDVGLTSTGVPGSWARCWKSRGGCGALTCGMGIHLVANARDMIWDDGHAAGTGRRVPTCTEGRCASILAMCESAAAEFAARPNGSDAEVELAAMKRRAVGAEQSWLAICARVLIEVHHFYQVVAPALRKQEVARVYEAREAGQEVARRAERTVDGVVLSVSEFAAHKAAQREAKRAMPDPLAEILAASNPGVDSAMAAVFKKGNN